MSREEFSVSTRKAALKRAKGKCECGCGMPLDMLKGFDFDHVIPCKIGGDNSLENCAVVNRTCHKAKTASEDMPRIKKVRRADKKRLGLEPAKQTLPGSRKSKWKRKVGGGVVLRDED